MTRVLVIFNISMVFIGIVIAKSEENSQVDVRAVFINCEPNDRESITVDDATRFEREELFKHSVLQDCNKKIVLTVKIASEPDYISGDEYIPVEHVFRGPNKRIRLLDPYVLRLRREIPLQAYKLRRMASVSGVLSNPGTKHLRESRNTELNPRSHKILQKPNTTSYGLNDQDCDFTEIIGGNNSARLNNRDKRHEHNIVVEDSVTEEKHPRHISNNRLVVKYDKHGDDRDRFYEIPRNFPRDDIDTLHRNKVKQKNLLKSKFDEVSHSSHLRRSDSWSFYPNEQDAVKTQNTEPHDWLLADKDQLNAIHTANGNLKEKDYADSENEFDMYEIGNPDLLYSVQVQLFEKLTTPEGKTVWNDMTKGEPASVSTFSPEWVGQDMNIRYRPTEWVPREEFTLPLTSLCLLTPFPSSRLKAPDAENIEERDLIKKYIVVPKEDILSMKNENDNVKKRDENSSKVQYSTEPNGERRRRVIIRTSRAIFNSKEDQIDIAMSGGEQFLTMPHRRPHHAQIDLEARADENQLVPVGSSGRIMTVVADGSRRTRTTLTIQATNTGLAAAKFRAVVRDCGPELLNIQKDNAGQSISNEPILLPPKHTRNILLNVPTEIPSDITHCFVSLVNEEDESVAVRDVTMKKGDRCFCVWHCECVCLSEDPKLICREMTEARQIAAGLSLRERVRHARSICYHDVVSINMLVTAFGVIITLLFFGLVKAFLGLIFRCIGSWGLHRLVQMPRKLDHYYESSLRDSRVVYDSEGWPVHPTTKERSVQLVSKSMEFILNVIFFVTTPCVIVYEILKDICNGCKKNNNTNAWKPCENNKNCYSSHDIQSQNLRWRRRRKRQDIKKWMTPAAEEVSTNIWQENLPEKPAINNCMLPLLREEFCHDGNAVQPSCADSEGDDTEYVLMQMQKSKESLARSQRKLNSEK